MLSRASRAVITAFSGTFVNKAILALSSLEISISQRARITSAAIPIERNSLTECWVGFVLISLAAFRYGTSVRCINIACRPYSTPSCRIASRKGSDSISPTVPPISIMATSKPSAAFTTFFLISSVMCGITCTVPPR